MFSDDPRFGGNGRYVSAASVNNGGIQQTMTRTKTATVSDPLNPLSVTQVLDKITWNQNSSQTYTTTTDAVNRVITNVTPQGYTSVMNYDANSNIVESQPPGGVYPTFLSYDADGRVSQISQGMNCNLSINSTCRTTSISYIPSGQLGAGLTASITDAIGNTTSFVRDAAGRVTGSTTAGVTTTVSYDGLDNVISILAPGHTSQSANSFAYSPVNLIQSYTPPVVAGLPSDSTSYAYDLDREFTGISLPDVSGTPLPVSFSYDPTSARLLTRTQPEGVVTFSYDNYGNISGVAGPSQTNLVISTAGSLVQSTQFGNVPTANSAPTARWTYDSMFQVATVGIDGGNSFNYKYDNDEVLIHAGDLALVRGANGLPSSTTLGSVVSATAYDNYGEISSFTASFSAAPIYSASIAYDSLGRIKSRSETAGNSASEASNYQYDGLGRLSSVTNSSGTTTYTYDANGNRLNNGATYDVQDRLANDNLYTYTYDGRGALRQKVNKLTGQISNYTYDVFGNLMSATMGNGKSVNYELDGLGRRVARQANGGAWTGFIYQGQQVIGTVDASGNVTSQYVYATRGNVPDEAVIGGTMYRIISDERGSVRMVVNGATGVIAEEISYDEWGDVLSDTNPGFQPFGFAGGLYDSATGLTRFGARDYDPTTGRFVSKDPLLFGGGQTNLYVYVGDNPVNEIDPSGTNVYLINTASVHGWHQAIVVDTYAQDGKPNGLYGQSFGVADPNSPWQSGASGVMPQPGLSGSGVVYQDQSPATKIQQTFLTTPAEDVAILHYLQGQLGNTGPYSPFTNSCRTYSQQQFNNIVNMVTNARNGQ